MTAAEWEQRQKEAADLHDELVRAVRRLEAGAAQRHGIDIFQPGWRDEFLEFMRERNDSIDALIATPHVGEALAGMEEQFSDGSDAARHEPTDR